MEPARQVPEKPVQKCDDGSLREKKKNLKYKMGYKETYKEDWNLKKYGILQSRTLCKKICGERPTVMVKQYR